MSSVTRLQLLMSSMFAARWPALLDRIRRGGGRRGGGGGGWGCWSRAGGAMLGGVLAVLLIAGGAVHAQPAPTCAEAYAQAEEAYFAAEFDRTVRVLQACLEERAPSDSTRLRAYRLLGFAHLANNDRSAARVAVETLLDIRPTYTPNPSRDRPDFVALVERAKRSRQAPAPSSRKPDRDWVRWILGGVAVAAVTTVAVLILGGDGGTGDGDDDNGDDIDD